MKHRTKHTTTAKKKDVVGEVTEPQADTLDYLESVVDEKANLDDKIAKLEEFLGGPDYAAISATEQSLLQRQHDHMVRYAAVLAERVAFHP